MRKWLFIIVFVLLIVAPLALVGTVLYTQTGVALIAGQLHRLERFGVHIEGLSGTLSGPLRIERFELDNPHVHIVSHDLVAQLQLRDLLVQTVRVNSLIARDTLVEIRHAPPTPPSGKPMRFLPSFMRISARSLDFTRLHYVNIDGTAIEADRLQGRARISPRNLRIGEFRIDAPQFGITGNGRLRAQDPLALEFKADGNLRLERGTEVAGNAQVSGTLDKLAIKAALQRPHVIDVDALFTRPEDQWHVAGQVTSSAISLEPWMEKPPVSFRNIALKVDAQPDNIHVAGNIGVPEFDSRDLTLDAQGKFAQRTLEISTADISINESPARLHLAGSAKFDGDAPTVDVAAQWTDLQWPLHEKPMLSSTHGNLTLRGSLPYEYALNAQLVAPSVGESEGTANGVLSKEQITVKQFAIRTLEGAVTGAGSLQFQQPRAWTLSAKAVDLNPGHVHEQFPGRVSFDINGKGQGLDKQARFSATLAGLSGTLREQRVSGSGFVEHDGKTWRAQNVNVSLGDARLALDGTLRDTIDARWSLQAQSLHTLLPQAQGKVDFSGSAQGPLKAPHVVANLQAQGLRYEAWRVDQLAVDGDVDLGGSNPSRLSVRARRGGHGEPLVESLQIDGTGVAQNHRIDVDVLGMAGPGEKPQHAKLQIDGNYAQEAWSGTLYATEISDGRRTGDPLVMRKPANFLVARNRASVEQFCIALGNGQFCAEGKWQRNGPWEGTVSGYELPLAAMLPPPGEQAQYSGRIEGRVHASGTPGQPWQGEAGARIIDAAIIYRPVGAAPETLNLGNGGLAATADAQRVDFSLGVQAFADTFLYANAQIARNGSNDLLHLPLTGDIRARAADANILPIVFEEIDNAAGLLTANIDVRGTLAAPEISGRVELNNGAFDTYRVNLALRELHLVADLESNGLDFSGSGKAGEGQLNVGGHLSWRGGVSRGELQLRGQNLLVADLPEYRVVASPDLKFLIDGTHIDATGDVMIPTARIQPVNLSGAVQASDDARYVGEHPAEREGRLTVRSEIRIDMGDDVRVDAFGLQGRITGGVGTTVATGATPIGRGELSVADGRYEAYGQKLDITRGRLLFDASSLDDPALDIEAQRKLETVKVGMNVRGTLRSPRLSFFSDPSMPQTQIVSYLLVGKGIDNMQSGDTATMSSARDTLALQGGGLLASQLGRRLGLEEVGVESSIESSGEKNASLVLGKFLSPRLFVSYGISLTESINTLKLRYTISDKWVLKMEAGENQSADAEYTIERQ